VVDNLRSGLAVRSARPEGRRVPTQERIVAWRERDRPELFAHAPARDHLACQVGRLLDVVFSARGAAAIHDFFGRTAAHGASDPRAQVFLAVVVAIVFGPLIRYAERLPARHDRHPIDRVGVWLQQAENGVATLVIGDTLAFAWAHDQVAGRA